MNNWIMYISSQKVKLVVFCYWFWFLKKMNFLTFGSQTCWLLKVKMSNCMYRAILIVWKSFALWFLGIQVSSKVYMTNTFKYYQKYYKRKNQLLNLYEFCVPIECCMFVLFIGLTVLSVYTGEKRVPCFMPEIGCWKH